MDVFNNKDLTISFKVDESDFYAELTDEDRIRYTLYDLEGNVVEDIDNKSLDVDEIEDRSSISITIPAECNTIQGGELFSDRILIVNYSVNENNKSKRIPYRIIPFVPYSCTNDDVRNIFGLSSETIEDSMIDIYGAYLKCKSLLSDGNLLDQALKSHDIKAMSANKAICICSALTFRNSLQLLIPKIESNGVASQTRFTMSAEDFAKLFEDLQAELEDLLLEITDETAENIYSPELFVVGDLTDTFTGS